MTTQMEPFRVYVDGIFDLFHDGHAKLFQKAINKAGEFANGRKIELLVGVCEKGVAEYKRKTIMDCAERTAAVAAHHLVTKVVPDCPIRLADEENFMGKHGIDLVIHGDDFDPSKVDYYYGVAKEAGKFAFVPYEPGVSTTTLLTEAKLHGKFSISTDLCKIDKDVLIQRIQARSWEELNIKPPVK